MESEKSLVKAAETRLPKFVEDAYESIDKMEHFAKILLDSRLVPEHFYEKLPAEGNKKALPDFTKGKVPAVVAVLIQGYQLQLPPLTALQHIIPVNGLLSIKGDLAKSMIFNSGKLKPGSWVEAETGSIDAGDLVVTITATRSDNGQTLSRSFSVAQAKRAGLWVTEAQVNGQDGWKYKPSAWWKYPARMINYRALGFLARDMFPDVMAGIYTTEEAMDLPKDTVEVIETEGGNKITIPDKEHSKQRSAKMTDRVADKIPDNKFGAVTDVTPVTQTIMPATVKNESDYSDNFSEARNPAYAEKIAEIAEKESPFIAGRGSVEYIDGKEIKRGETTQEQSPAVPGQLTLEIMEKMETPDLLKLINDDLDMMDAMEMIPGKNTNKKLRLIIDAHQRGVLAEYVASEMPKEDKAPEPPVNTQAGEMAPNKAFDNDKQVDAFLSNAPIKKEEPKAPAGNKYNLEVPAEAPRDFSWVKQAFNRMMGLDPQITTPRYMMLSEKLGYIKTYPDKEAFLKYASAEEIDSLLNAN